MSGIIDFLQTYNGAVTAVATIFIGVFTYVLAKVTSRSIDLARKEFNATHRPRVRVRRIEPQPFGNPVKIQYTVVNIGETDAFIKRHDITLFTQPGGNGAEEILQSASLECPQLKGGEPKLVETDINIDVQYSCGFNIAAGTLKIRGIVRYEDGSRTTRCTGFLRTYDANRRGFRPSDDKEEEYED